jgi:hypothetical protein
MIKKVLQPTNDAFVQFTEEELESIGAGPGTKFSVKLHDDGSVELRPYVKMEVDIENWSREVLELIIKESCERDVSVNDVIIDFIKESINKEDISAENKEIFEGNLQAASLDPNFTNQDTSVVKY